MTRISCYLSEAESANAAQILQSQGIGATSAVELLSHDKQLGVIEVTPETVDAAIAALSGDAGAQAIRCPDCGSAHVHYPNRPEASPTAGAIEAVREVLKLTERTFFCHACHYEWSHEEK